MSSTKKINLKKKTTAKGKSKTQKKVGSAPGTKALRSRKKPLTQKYIFVTGGVVSSIGKGLTAASLGTLLEAQGIKVSIMKCDPYINVDPGTMSPLQHGEVYVTDDGAETDLDLGHYERFTQLRLRKANSITAGQIYESVIAKERRGDYLGGTVQVIPHITNEIKSRIHEAAQGSEILIVEIGGTIGDIEGLPFIEAIRQLRVDVGPENSTFVHVTYVPFIAAAGELKSKPTQHSVKELREVGIQPDFLICRGEREIPPELKSKIGLFCSVRPENVIGATDSKSIYEVPLGLHKEGFDRKVVQRLGLPVKTPQIEAWAKMVRDLNQPKHEIQIGLVGKYVDLKESYKSLHESLIHGGISKRTRVHVRYIDSEELEKSSRKMSELKGLDGLLVPGGFGPRGAEGKVKAIRYARENKIPFLGICYGMQLAAIEFARNVCGFRDATSRELLEGTSLKKNIVIDFMDEQKDLTEKGGTMRLGAYNCELQSGSLVRKIYGKSLISERHRHRYEFNDQYGSIFEKNGMRLSGICLERELVEIIEIPSHPWFIGVQFHPEFQSGPLTPHPLFASFIGASLSYSQKKKKGEKSPVKLNPKKRKIGSKSMNDRARSEL